MVLRRVKICGQACCTAVTQRQTDRQTDRDNKSDSQGVHLYGVETSEDMRPGMLYSGHTVSSDVLLPHENSNGVNP